MAAALMAPVAAAAFLRFDLALLYLGMALLVIWKHQENIRRLAKSEEPRIGRKQT